MPPFPHSWEDGLQILLHVAEPIIQRRRRLEAKRRRLEDWLRLLTERARRGPEFLQSAVQRFLRVDEMFPQADSAALFTVNSVTSLVTVNSANVETILLKLAQDCGHLVTAKGKHTLNLARQGPDRRERILQLELALATLPSSLGFDLSKSRPTCRLSLRNPNEIAQLWRHLLPNSDEIT